MGESSDEQNIPSYRSRRRICIFVSLASCLPVGLIVGSAIAGLIVELAGISGFEGGSGYAVITFSYIAAPVVAMVSIVFHVIVSKKRWPILLFMIDLVSIIILIERMI